MALVRRSRESLERLALVSTLPLHESERLTEHGLPWRSLACLSTWCNLRDLRVESVVIPSISALLRLLSRIPRLAELKLMRLRWITAPPTNIDDWHPDCNGGFRHLEYIFTTDVPEAWLLVWAIAGRCFGVEKVWSRRSPAGVDAEMSSLAKMMYLLWKPVTSVETWADSVRYTLERSRQGHTASEMRLKARLRLWDIEVVTKRQEGGRQSVSRIILDMSRADHVICGAQDEGLTDNTVAIDLSGLQLLISAFESLEYIEVTCASNLKESAFKLVSTEMHAYFPHIPLVAVRRKADAK